MAASKIAMQLERAADAYYNKGSPLMSDDAFDALKDELEKLDPKHPFLKKVGAPVATAEKVKLPYWMGSLDKIRDDPKVLKKWIAKFADSKEKFTISDKLDGNSALLVSDGKSLKMYSRGDGEYGQDVSHIIPFLSDIPLAMDGQFAFRGELIISRAKWARISDTGANARNVVAGMMHAKTPNPDILRHIDFVIYEVIKAPPLPHLYKLRSKTVYETDIDVHDITIDNLSDILMKRRAESEYDIDGIVITHVGTSAPRRITGKNPSHAFAFKSLLTHEEAEVVVKEVEWNASKDGYLKPIVLFDPVEIAGVKISKATGFNAAFIETNRIGPGARIIIIRSGDVIPHILRVIAPSTTDKAALPSGVEYRWNETHVDIIVDGASDQVDLRQMEHFCKTLDMKHVAAGILKKLYDNGINTIPLLLKITENQIGQIDGFKDTMANKVVKSIREGFARATCEDLMVASNIFGRGFGKKRIELIASAFPDMCFATGGPALADLEKIEGIGHATATAFVAALPAFHSFCAEIGFKPVAKDVSEKEKEATAAFANMTIVFTGFRNPEWERAIVAGSGKVTSTVSRNTSLVVAANADDGGAKIAKARDLGIPMMSRDAFASMYHLH